MEAQRSIRILVVEDELLIALMLQDILADLGFSIVGPAMRLTEAINLIGVELIDGAILDVNLRGEKVYPAADMLLRLGVPVILCTGYGSAGAIPARYAAVPRVTKPFDPEEMRAIIGPLFTAPLRPPTDVV